MVSRRDRSVVVGAVALSAIGLFFVLGLHPIWWLMWVAPIPVLVVALRRGATTAFAAGFCAWLLGELTMWTYMTSVVHVPVPITIAFLLLPAAVFGGAAALASVLAARGKVVAAALAIPSVWVAAIYVISVSSPHGTFGSLAYTQMDLLPVVQLASVTGVWGIDFLVLLVPSTAAVALSARGSKRATAVLGAACTLCVALVLGFGAWRLASAPRGSEVAVGLAAADTPRGPVSVTKAAASEALKKYAARLDALGAAGARVVVIPETVVTASGSEIESVERAFGDVASRHAMHVVAGIDRIDDRGEYNTALVFGPDGAIVGSYEKQHLLPDAEQQYRRGSGLLVVEGDGSPWGVAICKDMDFPSLGRQYAARGVTVLLVPAWDFDRDGWLHGRMAVMRGVESGFAIARSARRGSLTISDTRGRVVAETESSSAPVATLSAHVTIARVDTLYARIGDLFAWGCVVLAVGFGVSLIGSRARD